MNKKITMVIVMALLCLHFSVKAQQTITSGRVVDAGGGSGIGAVEVRAGNKVTFTDARGNFSLSLPTGKHILSVAIVGYTPQSREITAPTTEIIISMQSVTGAIEEVAIVSTGYQRINRERITGSVSVIDSALLARSVSTSVLERLEGVVPGLVFNRNLSTSANNSSFSIRGRSTIFGNTEPLIIVDNFPYEGDINSINPNDIEDISILKDAAAAAVWGVRAGNGVVVITTKKGSRTGKPAINFSSNISVREKEDAFATPRMTSGEFLELEQFLFSKGMYNTALNSKYTPVTEGVRLLGERRSGLLSAADSLAAMQRLAATDVRTELSKHYLREAVNQQYALNIAGGGPSNKYFVSGGLDRNTLGGINRSYTRASVTANNSYFFLKDRLELFAGLAYTANTEVSPSSNYTPFSPYDRLEGAAGEALAIDRTLKGKYTDTAGKGALLDWKYRPLDEINDGRKDKTTDLRLNLRGTMTLLKGLNVSLNYLYQHAANSLNILDDADSYDTRNMINSYASVHSVTGVMTSPIGMGAILNQSEGNRISHSGRLQADYTFRLRNGTLNAVAGSELRVSDSQNSNYFFYGYDAETQKHSNALINPTATYRNYYSGSSSAINTLTSLRATADRFRSYYGIVNYTTGLYTLSGSVRKDESNLFGAKSNQRGVPLWSLGARVDLTKIPLLKIEMLPVLAIRSSFGYSGNIDRSLSPLLTASVGMLNYWGERTFVIENPPNPSLRWERVQNLNLGVDFGFKNNVISGSIEYFVKNGKDLIASAPILPQTGLVDFRGNTANTRTTGLDIVLNANLAFRSLRWNGSLLLSRSMETVTKNLFPQENNVGLVQSNFRNPMVGYPYNSVFSFKSNGLDANGNPTGFFNGLPGIAYSSITNSFNRDDLVFHGSAVPTIYGGFINSFSYGKMTLSVNIIYKLGYYYRRTQLFSGSNYTFNQIGFSDRWQAPGDELKTEIPSLIYPSNNSRATVFSGSSRLVERGDHIRLRDVQFSYALNGMRGNLFKGLSGSVFGILSNGGILWAANKQGFDPDYSWAGTPLTISLGVKLNIK